MTRSLIDASPLPKVLAWLRAHPTVTTHLGGVGHVGGRREAPWPHLQVTFGAGSNLGDGRGTARFTLDYTVWGHPDRRDSTKALHDALIAAMEATLELADTAPYTVGDPVISEVILTFGPDEQNTTSGQQRWVAAVQVETTPPA